MYYSINYYITNKEHLDLYVTVKPIVGHKHSFTCCYEAKQLHISVITVIMQLMVLL